ncbi:conserved repeat protein [Bernardetia litoralis DSM 6794]|uniref:Conserved repeat protein n=1 Tax=Bernardetia litoralis (strain ATCC 23117 / DSM 6794 / NBRC 15988 / NCIMB 1366 / Fx l1 / Sio-4) TaxID=880071 RepID=I4AQQ6_BERLS|nr:T9SS type A sorting domain-containing protein [Bernardetia litoralis]AFM06291.1 conserved repeat protein [Bernardetia litoralis DSM 6794]
MKQFFTCFLVLLFSCTLLSNAAFAQVWTDILELHYCDVTSIKIDADNNKIISGFGIGNALSVEGTDIPFTQSQDAKFFVAKISPTDEVIWMKNGEWFTDAATNPTYNPYNDLDFSNIEIDNSGNIHVVFSSGYNRTLDRVTWANRQYNQIDNFILKLSSSGNEIWHKALLLHNESLNVQRQGTKIAIDNQNNVFLALTVLAQDLTGTPYQFNIDGTTFTIPKNTYPPADQYGGGQGSEVLTLKFTSNGQYLWNRQMVSEFGYVNFDDLIVDSNGNPLVSIHGLGQSLVFNGSSESNSLNGVFPSFLIKYNTNGDLLSHEQILTENGYIYLRSLLYQIGDNTFLAGQGYNIDPNQSEFYVTKLDANLNVVSQFEVQGNFGLQNMVVDNNENIYVAISMFTDNGSLSSINLGSTSHILTDSDIEYFLVKMNQTIGIDWGVRLGVSKLNGDIYNDDKRSLDIDNRGYVYVSGVYVPNSTIGTTTLPNVPFIQNTEGLLQYIGKIRDDSFVFPIFRGEGKTFAELNTDCQLNSTDKAISSILIKRNDGYYAISNLNGDYLMPFSEGNYTLRSSLIDTNLSQYITSNCDIEKQVSINGGQIQDPTSLHFGYQTLPCSYLTIAITNKPRRRCFMSSTTVEYQNKGFADANNVEIKVEYPDYIFPVSSLPAWTRKEGNNYFFNVGSLAAGNTEKIVFQDSVICGIEEIRGLTQCVKATISPANSCEDWTDNENKYEITGQCVGGGIARYTIKNLTATSTDSIPYRLYANSAIFQEGNVLLPANGEIEFEVFTNGATVRMEVFPPNHEPISEFVEGCQTIVPYSANPATPLSSSPVTESGSALPQNDGGERMETSCSEILDSYDPNDKQVAPFGLTNENLIEATTELDYTIRFQNTGTIEAVNIVVLDTLSEYLDIETIRLGMVSHDYNFFIDGDADTRVLRFEFDNINLPDSNSNEPASHGFIKFKIKQKANNRIGTVIKNRAAIYFDFNSPIITNTISNKIAILPLRNNNLDLAVFDCSNANFELIANAGTDIETPNSTATLAAQTTQAFGGWSLLAGFGELEDTSKNNSGVTGILPFPSQFVWTVAACKQSKQDTVTVLSTDANYKFTIDLNENTNTLSIPTGKVMYQWYKDGVLITGQTDATLNLNETNSGLGVYTVVISGGGTSITSEPFTLDVTLSNDDFITANYIKVYPNPTTSLLNVELNMALNATEVSLVNALGIELQKTKITNSNTITLDLENLSNGIYFVKIVSQKGIFYKKVVLKK